MNTIEMNIELNYFTFHQIKYNRLWHRLVLPSKGTWDKEQHENCDLLQAMGAIPSNTLWQAFPSSEKKCPKTLLPHLSISWLKIWPGFNQDLYNWAIVLFINDPVYWHLTSPVGLTLGVKSGGKNFDPDMRQVNIIVPAHLPMCKNACVLNAARQHLIRQIT